MLRFLFVIAAGYVAYRLLHKPQVHPTALLPPPADGDARPETEDVSVQVPSEAG